MSVQKKGKTEAMTEYKVKHFSRLSTMELYEILRTRAEIFVVEQDCVYQDLDGKDQNSIHIFSEREDGRVTSYLRAFKKADEPNVIQLGRVVTLEHGKGLGGELLLQGIMAAEHYYGYKEMYLEAQTYAIGYYQKQGFEVVSDEFLEDGISHVKMRRKASLSKEKIKIDVDALAEGFGEEYEISLLQESDIPSVVALCEKNELYYKHCPPMVNADLIRADMAALPPDCKKADKYYLGIYHKKSLVAVADFISGYPNKTIAFIGFFMTEKKTQGKGLASWMIDRICEYFKQAGFESVRLAWVKTNPQSEHFWRKNQFMPMMETDSSDGNHVILAERFL